jgi:hypothetical protein
LLQAEGIDANLLSCRTLRVEQVERLRRTLFLLERLDQRHQNIWTKRLDQMMIKPCLPSTTAIFSLSEARNGRHQWLRRAGLGQAKDLSRDL